MSLKGIFYGRDMDTSFVAIDFLITLHYLIKQLQLPTTHVESFLEK